MKIYTPSTYLKHQDLDEQDWILTIDRVEKETIKSNDGGNKEKFILYFRENDRGLILNATNIKTLCKLFNSDDSDVWIGKRITLFVKNDVEFAGELVSAIRIRPKAPL